MNQKTTLTTWIGLVGGPVLALTVLVLLADADLSSSGRATASIGVLMAVWWMTEAIPLPATSLLPLVLFPLAEVFPTGEGLPSQIQRAATPYAHPYIFLFFGGFIIALAMERWNLHRRVALLTVLAVGTRPTRLVAGFMLATAGISMWISNTASTVLMLPIGMSVIHLVSDRIQPEREDSDERGPVEESSAPATHFAPCLMLAIAYSASIGGTATLIGTPPNAVLAAYLDTVHDIQLGFGRWMLIGFPLVAVFLVLSWLLLTRLVFPIRIRDIPGGRQLIRGELAKLGRVSRGERMVLTIFVLTALGWILREPLASWDWLSDRFGAIRHLHDAGIALTGALLLFALPVDLGKGTFLMNWESTSRLPWGVLLLFGGGMSLASAVSASGLAEWIAARLPEGLPLVALIVLTTTVVVFLTELTSNLATAAAFLPILGGVAVGIGATPLVLVVPAALAASCAFMLPVATPPNAIVFGSGSVTVRQMAWAGFWMNLLSILLVPLVVLTIGKWALGGG